MMIREICQKLNITNTTLKSWIDTFPEYFSDEAKGYRRAFEAGDLDMLATIATLSHDGFKYDKIRERLEAGYREEFENKTFGIDTRVMAVSTANATIDAAVIRMELEKTQQERDLLLQQLQSEQSAHKETRKELEEKIVAMQQTMDDLRERAVRAETIAEYLRGQNNENKR